jgi:ketosteroid isomerase-like protein
MTRCASRLLACLCLPLGLTACSGEPGAATPAREADIETLTEAKEVAWNGFYRRRDAEGLADFLADGFILLNPDGTKESKADAVAYVRDNEWPGASSNFEYKVTAIEFYGPDTANVFGQGLFDSSEEGEQCRMRYTSSNIFVRQGDGWHPIFSHTSPAYCPAEEGIE